jgi:hypothetical protein
VMQVQGKRVVLITREQYELAACGWLDIEAAKKLIEKKRKLTAKRN